MPARHSVVFPIPGGALEPERERPTLAIEETSDPIELRVAADDILEREASFPDCRHGCLLLPSVRPAGAFRQPDGRTAWGARGQNYGDFSISAFPSSP